ncbi:MAG: deoxyribonuclease IV [Chloroflexota bacterium]|nr:deoxyribonuclease IV [Chloroflexota bacterium]MDQ5867794.1 deoxyribonuclease IV [Chloroflexota bacterium]
MKLGAHMSIAGGYYKALELGQKNCCTVVQLFTKNASQWAGKPLSDDECRTFMQFRDTVPYANTDLVAHDSYLINLASPDDVLWEKSIAAFAHELDRCEALCIPNLVTHAGAHMGSGEERGLERIASAIERVLAERPGQDVMVLLETTAGQGTSLCYAFEHLASVRDLLSPSARARVGVCWDTCHLLAAGFDYSDEYKYERMVESFDRLVGLDTLRAIHMNDSKKGLGSRVDRHEHIGKGALGLEPFRFIMNDPRFENVPKILETPKEGDKGPDGKPIEMDPINLEALKSLVK